MAIQALPSIRTTLARLVNAALERLADGDRAEAEQLAYEAGRYGMPMPEKLAAHENLVSEFRNGQRDVVEDAADAERAEAIAEAGFDPAGGLLWMERADFLALASAITRG